MKKNKFKSTILLTRKETTAFLKISLATLHRWTKDGLLRSYSLGGKVYYKQHELLHALKEESD